MGGKASRTKGHDFERKVAKELRELTGLSFKRGFQTRGGGAEQADVFCHGQPFHFECKKGKGPPMKAALIQAEDDAEEGDIPIAVVAFDREEPIVLLRWSEFKKFLVDHLDWERFQAGRPAPKIGYPPTDD